MPTRLRTSHTIRALAFSLLWGACVESGDDNELYEAGFAPVTPDAHTSADAANSADDDAGAGPDAGWRFDAAAASRDAAPPALESSVSTFDALPPELDADDPNEDTGTPLDAETRRDAATRPDTGAALPDSGTRADASTMDPVTSTEPLVGVYCGNSVDSVRQFETWLGRPVDGILGYTGNASWADYDGSVGWAAGVWAAIDRRVLWSVPLIVNGASLAQAASGAYDEHYRKAAQTLARWRPQEPKLYIRTGWEFNGNWFPWNAQGKAADFKAAFRRFVSVFRAVSDRFVFEWNVNIGDVGMDPETAYPGDDVVDIVGMDFYWQTHLPTNPQQAWSQIVNQKWGLKWHQDFAKAHGKRTAYSEWGVRYDNAGYYIEQAKLWFAQHQVVYQTYWNADNDYPGKLSSGQYPTTGTAYRRAFGR